MAELIVNGTTYNYPDPGTEPGWGEDATAWAEAITEIVNSLAGAGSIPETEGTIVNGAVDTPISGLIFSSSFTFSAVVFYRIFRDTDSVSALNESGVLNITIDDGVWKMSRDITVGESTGVTMEIDDSTGEISYTASTLAFVDPDSYEGRIKFKTISIIS